MIHSFFMIGQSNMAGRGYVKDVPIICNERIKMLRNGLWQMMREPIHCDRPFTGRVLSMNLLKKAYFAPILLGRKGRVLRNCKK